MPGARLPPALDLAPRIVRAADIPPGGGRVLLLVVAHADDPAFFAAGPVAMWADAGWRVVCLRATDDALDSLGLDPAETVRRNAAEFRAAARILGIAAVEDLMWRTDRLGDASRVALRERIIRAIRRHRPFGLVTFDPDSVFGEDNLDHRVLAEAADEAFWCAQFDKHHPEHLALGLAPHGVWERWYFGRSVLRPSHVFDTAAVLGRQVEALLAHPTMLANILNQFALQAETAGADPAPFRAAQDDPRPLVAALMGRAAAAKGAPYGLGAAEWLRRARSDLPGAPPGAGGD